MQPWQPPPPHQQQPARQDPNQRQPYWPQQPQPTYPTSHTPNGTPGQYQQQFEQPGYFQNSAPAYNQQVFDLLNGRCAFFFNIYLCRLTEMRSTLSNMSKTICTLVSHSQQMSGLVGNGGTMTILTLNL